jgi:hypothetical protein
VRVFFETPKILREHSLNHENIVIIFLESTVLGIAWILECRKLAWEKCVWEGNPNQALPSLTPQKDSSRAPAAMEETHAKSTPYSFKMWHIRVSRVRILYYA